MGAGAAPSQPWQQPPHRGRGQGDEARDHADVKAGNRDQVGQAGGTEHVPVAIVQRPGIADRKGPHIARGGGTDGHVDPPGDAFAPGIDSGRGRQLPRTAPQHPSGGDDPSRQRVAPGIDAPGVGEPTRGAHPHLEPPARAGTQGQPRPGPHAAEIVVPGQLQPPPAHRVRLGGIAVDPEAETCPPGLHLGQRHHGAGDGNHAALQRRWQLRLQRPAGMQRGPAGTGQQRTAPGHTAAHPERQPGQQRGPAQPGKRQHRHPQHHADTGQEAGRGGLAQQRARHRPAGPSPHRGQAEAGSFPHRPLLSANPPPCCPGAGGIAVGRSRTRGAGNAAPMASVSFQPLRGSRCREMPAPAIAQKKSGPKARFPDAAQVPGLIRPGCPRLPRQPSSTGGCGPACPLPAP